MIRNILLEKDSKPRYNVRPKERRPDIEDKIQDMIRAAVYKYKLPSMDKEDTFQQVYLDYFENLKDTEDEWFENPSSLKILATSFKNKILDLNKMAKRRIQTQLAMPSSGIEEYTTAVKKADKGDYKDKDPMYRTGKGIEADQNPRNKETYDYQSSSKAWKPSERIDSPREMETRAVIRDMAHLVNNSYHEGSGEYMFFFGMLNIIDALHYVRDIIPTNLYKLLSKVEKSGDISQDILGIGRPGHSVYIRIANNVRNLLKKHGYTL